MYKRQELEFVLNVSARLPGSKIAIGISLQELCGCEIVVGSNEEMCIRDRTTLAPCWYCSGLIRQFGFAAVVVGESRNFQGGMDWLRSLGVRVIDLDSEECASLLGEYIRNNSEVWNEDIGEE